MAIPLIPILLAVAGLGSGIVQGISQVKNAKNESETLANNAQTQIYERQKQAKKLMQQQKTSFLKSGIYFDSGSPLEVIDETYDTMKKDVTDMANDANTKIKNLERQGKTAFFGSLIQGIANGAMSYLGANAISSGSASKFFNNISSKFANSRIGMAMPNMVNKLKGGFGSLPTNTLPTNSSQIRIV